MIKRLSAIALLALLPSQLSSADILSHWTFDEKGGDTAFDSAGSVDGTLLGDATFEFDSGIDGGAIGLDQATGDMVDFGDFYRADDGEKITIACWVNTTDTSSDNFPIAKHRSGVVAGWITIINTSGGCYGATTLASAYFSASCAQVPVGTTPVTDGEWHHIAISFNTGAVSVFVDGDLEGTSVTGLNAGNDAPILLGGLHVGTTPTPVYNGLVDDVQIYDHAVTVSQVASMFANPGETLPDCPTDLSKDGVTAVDDLLAVLGAWGCDGCPEDITGDGTVSVDDMLLVLGAWGECPGIE